MKLLSYLLIVSTVLSLTSCKNNDEPPTETLLPVVNAYVPETIRFDKNDTETVEKIKAFDDKTIVVNDASELPDDPIGFSNAYSGINFENYTLLLAYNVYDWTIDTYGHRYYYDYRDGAFNWAIRIGSATKPGSGDLKFSRYALLVHKIPEGSKVKIWFSLGALNWDLDQ